jgi:hypothetical protein
LRIAIDPASEYADDISEVEKKERTKEKQRTLLSSKSGNESRVSSTHSAAG